MPEVPKQGQAVSRGGDSGVIPTYELASSRERLAKEKDQAQRDIGVQGCTPSSGTALVGQRRGGHQPQGLLLSPANTSGLPVQHWGDDAWLLRGPVTSPAGFALEGHGGRRQHRDI